MLTRVSTTLSNPKWEISGKVAERKKSNNDCYLVEYDFEPVGLPCRSIGY